MSITLGVGKSETDFLGQEWVGRVHRVGVWGLHPVPSFSFLDPLFPDKPQDTNHSFEMTSGPYLGKLALYENSRGLAEKLSIKDRIFKHQLSLKSYRLT